MSHAALDVALGVVFVALWIAQAVRLARSLANQTRSGERNLFAAAAIFGIFTLAVLLLELVVAVFLTLTTWSGEPGSEFSLRYTFRILTAAFLITILAVPAVGFWLSRQRLRPR